LNIANEKGFLTVKIPLNKETTQNDILFFKEVIDGIMTNGAERGMYDGIGGKVYRAFRRVIDTLDLRKQIPLLFGTVYVGLKKSQHEVGIPQHVLIHDLRKLYEEARKRNISTIVLLFDECDLLAQNEVILQKIRNAFMEVDGYILVFSGTEKMFPALSDVFSPIPRFFKRIDVGNFKNIKETKECILKPLNEEERKCVDQTSIADIHRITNGSPYEINLICHYMYRRWKEGKISKIGLSAEVLDDVLNEIERLRKEGHHEIANKIKRYWIGQLKVLASLLEFPNIPEEWLVEYMLLDEVDKLLSKDIHLKKSIDKDIINQLKRDGTILEEDGRIRFKGDLFDTLYLKYFAASRGIKDFFIGFPDDPLMNLHCKFVENTLLKDFPEFKIHTKFDKRERIDGKTGQKFVIGVRTISPPGVHTILEFSPEQLQREFYLGVPNSIRFRVNVKWMKEGFVTQISFKKEEDKDRLLNRLISLKDKLELIGYDVLLEDEITWNNRGAEFSRQRKWPDAIECFDKAIEINPLFELPWANKARIYFNLKRYEEALECVNKTLDIHPKWAEALKLKGMILINLKRNEEALECLEKAINLIPEDGDAWDNKGRALFNLKKYGEAITCFNKALKFKKENCEILLLKGLSFVQLGRIDDAIVCFDDALKINPDFTVSLLAKGEALLRKKEFKMALQCFNDVLKKEAFNIQALIYKGLVLSELGSYEEAIDCCNKVLEIDQNNAVAWYNKACFEAKLGNKDNALKSLKRAIEIDKAFIKKAREEDDFAILRDDKHFLSLTKQKGLNNI